jgi:hypothetical protein
MQNVSFEGTATELDFPSNTEGHSNSKGQLILGAVAIALTVATAIVAAKTVDHVTGREFRAMTQS